MSDLTNFNLLLIVYFLLRYSNTDDNIFRFYLETHFKTLFLIFPWYYSKLLKALVKSLVFYLTLKY